MYRTADPRSVLDGYSIHFLKDFPPAQYSGLGNLKISYPGAPYHPSLPSHKVSTVALGCLAGSEVVGEGGQPSARSSRY